MKPWFARLKQETTFPWIVLFLAINVGFDLCGGTNPDSRFTLLASLAESGTFRIDGYEAHTGDWARTPDGHYYSNKAPAPALLGFPVYAAVDRLATAGLATPEARRAHRVRTKARSLKLLSYLFQVLPFALLLWACSGALAARGVSEAGRHATVLALAFGHTAALLMNTYFGHAMAAAFTLAAGLALLGGHVAAFALCLGLGVLSDYSVALLVPPLVGAAVYLWRPSLAQWGRGLAGAFVPAALWVWYHTACFGSPFTLPNKYQNPEFVDLASVEGSLWGIFNVFPQPAVLAELLVGAERGILWTQPWVPVLPLVVLGAMSRPAGRQARVLGVVCVTGLGALLLMNGAFGGWHAGLTPGPRYLSAVFPLFALWMGLVWDGLSQGARRALVGSVGLSVVFYVLVFSSHISTPLEPLWPYYLSQHTEYATATTRLRLALIPLLFAATAWWAHRRQTRRLSSLVHETAPVLR